MLLTNTSTRSVYIYWTITDVARALGVTKQAISARYHRGTMPPVDASTLSGTPLWLESTLEMAGVLG